MGVEIKKLRSDLSPHRHAVVRQPVKLGCKLFVDVRQDDREMATVNR
jgi:hypothetical protein